MLNRSLDVLPENHNLDIKKYFHLVLYPKYNLLLDD